ncbi:cell division protein FtsQ/DivIB [Neobacillus niacini]|uniref:cell division protein FtsQ/DivIB n=1 Tax=Neobacillus niacini TaxID=86668 RepID=UPI0021CB62B4|nr:cell division protein FtsQ/DivIB [Neobacillus niacini]MCM3768013.1 cell division protein FtsQ/DivIB [Neobacillus niacini]
MEKSKVVALEDRIPKLKEQRRRKANRRLILLMFLFFTMIALIVYAQSPLSLVKNISVTGNEIYSSAEIINQSGLSTETNIWEVRKSMVATKLQKLPEMNKAEVKLKWPNSVVIQVKEHKRIAYLKKDNMFYPVMENGHILMDKESDGIPANAPILFNFEKGDALNELVDGLEVLPNEIVNSISEIHYTPKKADKYHISLFMNDGFEVSATLRTFSEKMVHYPSIISQLDPDKKGIIDLEVGSYFKAFETEAEETKVENTEGEG